MEIYSLQELDYKLFRIFFITNLFVNVMIYDLSVCLVAVCSVGWEVWTLYPEFHETHPTRGRK